MNVCISHSIKSRTSSAGDDGDWTLDVATQEGYPNEKTPLSHSESPTDRVGKVPVTVSRQLHDLEDEKLQHTRRIAKLESDIAHIRIDQLEFTPEHPSFQLLEKLKTNYEARVAARMNAVQALELQIGQLKNPALSVHEAPHQSTLPPGGLQVASCPTHHTAEDTKIDLSNPVADNGPLLS